MKIVACKVGPDGDWNLSAGLDDGTFPDNTDVVVVPITDFDDLVETMRHACSVACGDLLAMGAPAGSSTVKLLLEALAAAAQTRDRTVSRSAPPSSKAMSIP